ncbi:hypothetical protein Cob_v000635 [Colletotrichum orbiculare MAFF 240422]|uniref:Uncharacterized protein n=1 Tax=Colletotrichum orbiculare (strain 104-T / ATCC 96160 / CBS 514.97 / LARS 414 / MAFF 240422) TaxID=1213857 RepID=A0A484G7C3_COLOR|nr:hypothetical protein Cob_v000635 [Colletotrichum orbiculare MAFF 240422]
MDSGRSVSSWTGDRTTSSLSLRSDSIVRWSYAVRYARTKALATELRFRRFTEPMPMEAKEDRRAGNPPMTPHRWVSHAATGIAAVRGLIPFDNRSDKLS